MSALSNYRANARLWLKGYILVGVAALTLGLVLYSNHLILRMRENAESTSRLFSRYIANVLFEISDDGSLADLREVIRDSHLPIIITVLDGRPILWHGVPVDERTEEDLEMLVDMDVDDPPTPKLRKLVELYREFDRMHPPIPIHVRGVAEPQGYVHYGKPELEFELRMMPFVMLAVFLVFMGVAIQALRYLKLSEQRSIWVGLARETAHQLGTPLSALMGWTQVIGDRARAGETQAVIDAVGEMEVDLERMRKVVDRFGKIGAEPERRAVDVRPLVERTVEYFSRRLPRARADSTITAELDDVPPVLGNAELLEWVLENLVRNAVDALGDTPGRITIRARRSGDGRHVEIAVHDSGRGIEPGLGERIFRPGVTTKKRGWGLGLALARRIVVDYHGGSIRVADSHPSRGTTFVVRLPVAPAA